MISPEMRETIITEIGPDYGNKILKFARKEKFKKQRGGGFYEDPQLFYQVLKGKYESLRLEKFILKVYMHYKKENEEHAEALQSILSA